MTAFCLDQVAPGVVVFGINGPQGCGKSTLAAHLVAAFAARGLPAVAVSIDDFYVTFTEQRALAARSQNPYLEHRGYPGTHDVALGARVLDALAAREPGDVAVPAYDKSRHGGRGDRAPEASWPRVRRPLRAIFLEGWMLGFGPVPEGSLADPALSAPNAALGAYAAWTDRLDAFVHLDAADERYVVDWRIDAERARRASGAEALTDDEARDYVERFLPAYRQYVPALRADPPGRAWLRVVLGPDRSPLDPAVPSPRAA